MNRVRMVMMACSMAWQRSAVVVSRWQPLSKKTSLGCGASCIAVTDCDVMCGVLLYCYSEWACYAELPGVAICQLQRREGIDDANGQSGDQHHEQRSDPEAAREAVHRIDEARPLAEAAEERGEGRDEGGEESDDPRGFDTAQRQTERDDEREEADRSGRSRGVREHRVAHAGVLSRGGLRHVHRDVHHERADGADQPYGRRAPRRSTGQLRLVRAVQDEDAIADRTDGEEREQK